MTKIIKLFFAFIMLIGGAVDSMAQHPSLIPIPNKVEWGNGNMVLKKNTVISCSCVSLRPAAEYLKQLLSIPTGYKFKVKDNGGNIRLALTDSGNAGSYRLVVSSKGILVEGSDYCGVINGIATLRQLLPDDVESDVAVTRQWILPQVKISDSPRFSWRGMELDVSRHFFTKEQVKKLLDVLALYKINKFHWHLVDDQGWRIEIKKYPLLTENGAWRKWNNQDYVCFDRAKAEDMPDIAPDLKNTRVVGGDTLYGGYYTQDDVREIVDYAHVRGIDIIPEIDMPGHSLTAISNYAGLSCFPETGWGKLFTSPMCPGKDKAVEFCKDIWRELFDIFPYRYVHMGGDEVDMKNWKVCPDCKKRMKDNGLQNVNQLQTWFNRQMEKFFNENGRKMICWDEVVDGGLTANSVVMHWRSWAPEAPRKTLEHGNELICTPNSQFYLDYQEDKNALRNIYKFNSIPAGCGKDKEKLVLGVQGNLWTEWVGTAKRMWYQTFPREIAIAELGWSKPENMNYADFESRLTYHFSRLQKAGVTYRIPDLCGFNNTNVFTDYADVRVYCPDKSAQIRYTVNGSMPDINSSLYAEPFKISKSTDFMFRTFGMNGRKGDAVKISFIKENMAPALVKDNLKNGLSAEWHEYEGADCDGIEKAPVNGCYIVNQVAIPDAVKGNIGLIITGYISVPADGIYTFALLSDDGSTLTIDNKMIVDNDREHSPREIIGQHALCAGLHPIKVKYFDHNGGKLKLRVMDSKGKTVDVVYKH